jgi:hypothetical protein
VLTQLPLAIPAVTGKEAWEFTDSCDQPMDFNMHSCMLCTLHHNYVNAMQHDSSKAPLNVLVTVKDGGSKQNKLYSAVATVMPSYYQGSVPNMDFSRSSAKKF